MSFINFLELTAAEHGYAKGILYVIYDILWKIVYAVGKLIDAITGLFYKLAGLDYLGSGSESLVEEKDILSQLFNQNIVSNVSLFMIFASVILMTIFGGVAVLKKLYFTRGESKSTVDIIKNMVLASVFLIFLSPLALFAISSISTITTAIAGIFGNDMNVSIADVMFRAGFSDDPIAAYNAIYSSKIAEGDTWNNVTSWVEMNNSDFLYELEYGGIVETDFYWYIYLLGGGIVLYNVVLIAFKLIKRLFNVIVLYLIGPIYVAKMVDDGGIKFREWKNKTLGELISVIGTVIGFMILLSLVGVIDSLELIETTVESTGGNLGVVSLVDDGGEGVTINSSAVLINNLTKIILLMAGTSVAKDSGDLLGNVFKGANEESNGLLEGIYEKISAKENKSSNSNSTPTRTRVITKNTTTTRRVMDYSQDVPLNPNNSNKQNVNIVNNQKNNFNTTVNNIDRKTNNLQNRTNVSISESGKSSTTGAKVGNYRSLNENNKSANPTDILNQTFTNYKAENDKLRGEWEFMKNSNSSDSKQVVRDFENASNDLDASIALGEQNKIKASMNQYVNAYKKEEKVAKEGYKDFAVKSAKLSDDLTMKQQEELKKISTAYKKAQVDYGKTARKLSEVSEGNISASEALRIKERADKQREKLMQASSKANDFYNNQKKGV